MKILLIAVGKLKERYLQAGIVEYTKRLRPYCDLKVVEVADEPTPQNASAKEEMQIKAREGERILDKIPADSHVVALAIEGKAVTSEQFAAMILDQQNYGKGHLTFIIGGSLGLSAEVLSRVDRKISFGKLTYPHQLMRLIWHEQIYRAFKIIKREPYHK